MLEIGNNAPEFCLLNEKNEEMCLKDFKGKWVVLYYYPKAMTPGCTTEACNFSDRFDSFEATNTVILGVSADSPARQLKFSNKHELRFPLLSDIDHNILKAYGVWKPKKLYGKEFLGIVRSTFIIDPEGNIAKIWPKVKVTGHADDVKESLIELQKK